MSFFELISTYLLEKPQESTLVSILLWISVFAVLFVFYQYSGGLSLNYKWSLFISLIPSLLVLAVLTYAASYGKPEIVFSNPGVYLQTLIVFTVIFISCKFISDGFKWLFA